MGNNPSVIRNIADISVRSDGNKVLTATSGAKTVFLKIVGNQNQVIFYGEISSHIDNLVRNVSLDESNIIRVKFSFSLNEDGDPFNFNNFIYLERTFLGSGNITFISTDNTVSSIPICIDSLTIDPNNNNLVRVVYKGYINKDISLNEGYDMDACVSFQITMPPD
jgi:hypothetical protein